jgi:hypothetical protein
VLQSLQGPQLPVPHGPHPDDQWSWLPPGPQPGPQGPEPAPHVPLGQGGLVTVEGMMPSDCNELKTEVYAAPSADAA